MEAFKSHKGIIAPLDCANVDTDQIIPKQFLKSIKRTGFEHNLFFLTNHLVFFTKLAVCKPKNKVSICMQ